VQYVADPDRLMRVTCAIVGILRVVRVGVLTTK
jgi:hypothetical protein